MGNQLVCLAPSQIYPVEHYVADIQVAQPIFWLCSEAIRLDPDPHL
jgi:hypothetical protein